VGTLVNDLPRADPWPIGLTRLVLFAAMPVFHHAAASHFSSGLNWLVAKVHYFDAVCCIVHCEPMDDKQWMWSCHMTNFKFLVPLKYLWNS